MSTEGAPLVKRESGFILWVTGLSGAGKSTLCRALHQELALSRAVDILDGDEVRAFLSRGLGFSRPDREENVRRIGFVARRLARHSVVVLCAVISPYRTSRDEVRRLAGEEGIPFLEIHVHAPLEVLIRRDVKGLYQKALSGELAHFTGISDPYEPPEAPELQLSTDTETVEHSVRRVLALLRERGLLTPAEQ